MKLIVIVRETATRQVCVRAHSCGKTARSRGENVKMKLLLEVQTL